MNKDNTERTTYFGLARYAYEYMHAAKIVDEATVDMREHVKASYTPTYFLALHSIELSFKAFLLLTDKLFYTQKKGGNGFTANTLCQYFHYLFRQCGIEGASSHSPRRTFITNLAEKGVSVRVLQSLAGHRNISTTQVYIDVNDAMKRRAVELI
jgi:site-specific recombinase XerD